ncbi:MAG TPA: IS21 family transposase, partial [Armatimonadota bacterium]|nr:IS21 family transposase [Armatimonadota bacterium]
RHQYVEFVFDQTIPTWIGCHRRAFESFAGVPCEVVVDNLKAAVIRAALEDPVLCTPYRQMAQHYGFLIHPCRVRTPAHKGKTESGVHYVQRNLVAGEEFLDILDANAKAARWVKEVAGTRVHGTTRQEPLQRFLEHEQAALLPLPTDAFELLETRPVMVHTDCHVILDGSYYSAPAAYVGKRLEAYLWERTVQLYEGVQLVVTHPRAAAPGERHTRIEHYPRGKAIYLERTPAVCRQMAAEVGPHCTGVVESILSQRPVDNLRAAQALVGLRERVGAARLEAACYRAIHYGDPHYRRVKSILAAGLEQEPLIGLELPPAPATHYTHARQPHEFFTVEREDTRC